MFYSQDILQKRGGKFGMICDDIIKYITLQAMPYRAGGPVPRLSLYLSSQLMFGVVRVYNRQQHYLFSDATALHIRCHNMLSACLRDIDLPMGARAVEHVTMGDVLGTPRCQVPVLEPFFGTLQSPDLPRPKDIPDIEVWLMPSSPAFPRLPSPIPGPSTPAQQPSLLAPEVARTPGQPFQPDIGSPHQARRDQITLREDLDSFLRESPITQPGIPLPGEADLPPLHFPEDGELPPLQTSRKNFSSEQEVPGSSRDGQSAEGEPPANKRRSKRTSGSSSQKSADQTMDGEDPLQLNLPPTMNLRRHLEEQGILDPEGRPHIDLPGQGQMDLLELGQGSLGLVQSDLGHGHLMDMIHGPTEDGQGDRAEQTDISGTDVMTTMRLEDVAPLGPTEETPAAQPAPENLRPQHRPASPGVTPRLSPSAKKRRRSRKLDLSLQLSPMQETSAATPSRRRRQINFADPEIQISKKKLRRNLETGRSTIREFVLPYPEPMGVAELFRQPGRRDHMSKTLRNLWERNCQSRPQALSEEDRRIWTVPDLGADGMTSSSSERDSPLARLLIPDIPLSPVREMETIVQEMEELREAPMSHGQSHYLSAGDLTLHMSRSHSRYTPLISDETPRDLSKLSHSNLLMESHFEDIPLENIPEEAEHLHVNPPRLDLTIPGGDERQQLSVVSSGDLGLEQLMSSTADLQLPPVTSGVEEMQQPSMPSFEVQENQLDEAAAQAPQGHSVEEVQDIFIRAVVKETSQHKWTTFRSICPITESRAFAAQCFTTLLDLCARRRLVAQQKKAYGDIYIAKKKQH